jgi:hypothetical protein
MAKRFICKNFQNWCTGEDSNLRSSKERQIYSLLPLTTRPPVQSLKLQNLLSKTQNKTREHSSAIEAAKPHLDKPRSEKDP